MKETELEKVVRERYGLIAKNSGSCCGPTNSCCDSASTAKAVSRKIGYSEDEIKAAPEGANLGLGCGNPVAIACLKEGETVLDLGSGAGFDCFLAAGKVGKGGRVVGVDMTPQMMDKARSNAEKGGYTNVEFRLGEIAVSLTLASCISRSMSEKTKSFA